MKKCNVKWKEKYKQLQDCRVECAIKDTGAITPMRRGRTLDKSIIALIRELDTKEHEEKAAKEVAKERWEYIGIEAQNCFCREVVVGALKCAHGYNHRS